MSKKPVTVTVRDIAETITGACEQPAAIPAWRTFKAIKPEAFAATAEAAKKKNDEDVKAGKEAAKLPSESQFGIEDARVRRHLDKFGLNASITAYVKAIKDKYKDKPKPEYTPDEKARRDGALDGRIRIGNAVPTYLRGFCEEIVNDLSHIAIESAIRAKRKIVLIQHIFDSNGFYINSAQFKNLFINLPSFVAAREQSLDHERRMLAARTVLTYLGEFSRSLNTGAHDKYELIRKNVEVYLKPDKKGEEDGAETAAPSAAPAAPVAAASASATSAPVASAAAEAKKDVCFSFYIKKMVKIIRGADPRYEGLRFSQELIPFIDTILNEFIQTVANRAIIHITTTEAQTVSTAVIRSIILGMMATPGALLERSITMEKTFDAEKKVDKYVPHIDIPNYVKFIDGLYPLGPKIPHPRAPKNKAPVAAAAASTSVAAPVAAPPKAEVKPVPTSPAPVVAAAEKPTRKGKQK